MLNHPKHTPHIRDSPPYDDHRHPTAHAAKLYADSWLEDGAPPTTVIAVAATAAATHTDETQPAAAAADTKEKQTKQHETYTNISQQQCHCIAVQGSSRQVPMTSLVRSASEPIESASAAAAAAHPPAATTMTKPMQRCHHTTPSTCIAEDAPPHAASMALSTPPISAIPSTHPHGATGAGLTSLLMPTRHASSSTTSPVLFLASASALSPPVRSYPPAWSLNSQSGTPPNQHQQHQHTPHQHEHEYQRILQTMPLPTRNVSSSSSHTPFSILSPLSLHRIPCQSLEVVDPPSPTLIGFTTQSDDRHRRVGLRLYEAFKTNLSRRELDEVLLRRHCCEERLRMEHELSHRTRLAQLTKLQQQSEFGMNERLQRVEIRLMAAIYDTGRGHRENRRRQEALRRLNEEQAREEVLKMKREKELRTMVSPVAMKKTTKPTSDTHVKTNTNVNNSKGLNLDTRKRHHDAYPPPRVLTPKRTSVITSVTTSMVTTTSSSLNSCSNPSTNLNSIHHDARNTSASVEATPTTMTTTKTMTYNGQSAAPTKASTIARAKSFLSNLFSRPTSNPTPEPIDAKRKTLDHNSNINTHSNHTNLDSSKLLTAATAPVVSTQLPHHPPHHSLESRGLVSHSDSVPKLFDHLAALQIPSRSPPPATLFLPSSSALRAAAVGSPSPRVGAHVLTPTYPRTPNGIAAASRAAANRALTPTTTTTTTTTSCCMSPMSPAYDLEIGTKGTTTKRFGEQQQQQQPPQPPPISTKHQHTWLDVHPTTGYTTMTTTTTTTTISLTAFQHPNALMAMPTVTVPSVDAAHTKSVGTVPPPFSSRRLSLVTELDDDDDPLDSSFSSSSIPRAPSQSNSSSDERHHPNMHQPRPSAMRLMTQQFPHPSPPPRQTSERRNDNKHTWTKDTITPTKTTQPFITQAASAAPHAHATHATTVQPPPSTIAPSKSSSLSSATFSSPLNSCSMSASLAAEFLSPHSLTKWRYDERNTTTK